MPIKINVGCGNKIFDPADGWINVDMPGSIFTNKPDVEADARALPFSDEYADEIHAIHLLEHFYIWETPAVLSEWNRVLKIGGKIFIELPDMAKVIKNILDGKACQKTWAGLYGDPTIEDPNMVHKWCFTFNMLKDILEFTGFENVVREEPYFHVRMRDMRVVATKKVHLKDIVCFAKKVPDEAWNVA